MKALESGRRRRSFSVAWACGAALVLSAACGSDDGAKKVPGVADTAGAGGDAEHAGGDAAGAGATAAAGTAGSAANGGDAGNGSQTPGGDSAGGSAGAGGSNEAASGAAGAAGVSGAAGAGGASCDAVDPTALEGVWTTTCNGYTCKMNVAASGKVATGCSNGQYATGTLDDQGGLTTLGEGGPYAAFSTAGTFTALDCSSLKYDYKGRTPPNTGTEQSYSCTVTRLAPCAGTLLETLAGTWETTCGSSTCTTTFTAEGGMVSTCSNGQHSTGSIDETGAFADTGSGGNQADYSTTGVIARTSCDAFLMPYTYQSPPNQGTKHAQQCTYARKVE